MSGFKLGKYEFIGDGSSLQGSNMNSLDAVTEQVKQNCRSILIGNIRALMSANPQWVIDSNVPQSDFGNITINTTDSNLGSDIPSILEYFKLRTAAGSSDTKAHYSCAQYLVNSVTGTKIVVMYIGYASGYHEAGHVLSFNNTKSPFFFTKLGSSHSNVNTYVPIGLSIAMIPCELNKDWNTYDWSDNNWCTSDMIYPVSNTNSYYATSGSYLGNYYNYNSIGFYNNANVSYKWYMIAKDDTIVFLTKASDWGGNYDRVKGFIIGKLFKENMHESDPYHYGCMRLYNWQAANSSSGSDEKSPHNGGATYTNGNFDPFCSQQYSGRLYNSFKLNGCSEFNSTDYNPLLQLYDASGSILAGGGPWPSGSDITANRFGFSMMCSTANLCYSAIDMENPRFVPLGLGIVKRSQPICEGDYFKGFIDTDLLRIVYNPYNIATSGYPYYEVFTRGRTFNEGDFIYIGGGLALGWDKSNTENPFE